MNVPSHRDRVSGTVLFIVAVVYFVGTWELPAGKGEPGPAFLPVLLSCMLMLLAISIVSRGGRDAPETDEAEHPTRWKPVLAFVLTAIYAGLFQPLGFALSTFLYTLCITLMFRRDRPVFILAVPVLSTALIYGLFRVALGVRLPAGPIPWL